jgi:hypothetical protein
MAPATCTVKGIAIDMDGGAIAANLASGLCVRKTTGGEYVVIVTRPIRPGHYRALKTLPTADRARAYMAACSR